MQNGQWPAKARRIWTIATRMRWALDRRIPLTSWAAEADMTVRTFHRSFQKVIGEPPMAYLRRLRLERSASWLAYTDCPVIDAALAGGYHSREGFSHVFQAYYHCTPITFRRQAREAWLNKHRVLPPNLAPSKTVSLPPMRIAAIPHLGPTQESIATWMHLGAWAQAQGYLPPSARPVGVLFDDEDISPIDKVRLDAGLVVDKSFCAPPEAPVVVYDIPGGRHVMAGFKGSVSELHDAWVYFSMWWFPSSKHRLRDSLLLTLLEPKDIPTTPDDVMELASGRPIRCRLCIPTTSAHGPGLPVVPFKRREKARASASRA